MHNPQADLEAIQTSYGPTSQWAKRIVVNHTPSKFEDSDYSTAHTIHLMACLAKRYAKSPLVLSNLQSAIASLENPTCRSLARQIFWFIKNRVMFVEDETIILNGLRGDLNKHKELLICPDALLSMPQPIGDCDDFSLLGASMLVACGVPTSYITVAVDRNEPMRFGHVYLKVYLIDEPPQDGLCISECLDISHGSYPGWEAGDYTRKREWAINF